MVVGSGVWPTVAGLQRFGGKDHQFVQVTGVGVGEFPLLGGRVFSRYCRRSDPPQKKRFRLIDGVVGRSSLGHGGCGQDGEQDEQVEKEHEGGCGGRALWMAREGDIHSTEPETQNLRPDESKIKNI